MAEKCLQLHGYNYLHQIFKVQDLAQVICSNWAQVIAEAVHKYAGSVYKDLILIFIDIKHFHQVLV